LIGREGSVAPAADVSAPSFSGEAIYGRQDKVQLTGQNQTSDANILRPLSVLRSLPASTIAAETGPAVCGQLFAPKIKPAPLGQQPGGVSEPLLLV